MEETEIDILIAKVLSNEATPEEQALLQTWRGESDENEAYFHESSRAFDLFSGEGFAPQVEAAWEKVNERVSNDEGRVVPLFAKRGWLRVAAAIFLVAGLSVVINYLINVSPKQELKIVADINPKQEDLPDGSQVRVEQNSSITYAESENGERVVKLKGGAFFSVVHYDKKPFVVQVQDVLVKDIGTAFQVTESKDGNTVEVKVDEGEVQFYSVKSSGLRLVKGESAVYDRVSDSFKKSLATTLESAAGFGSRLLLFNDSPLSDVLARVNAAYGSHVVLADPESGNCRLSVNFDNQPFEVVMDVITETLDLSRQQKGDTLILSGNGCK